MSLTIDRPSADHDDGQPSSSITDSSVELSLLARLAIAACLLGPAAIHFAMIPSHAAESAVEAVGFAIAGWLGALAAVATLIRPSRRLLNSAAVINLAMIGIWARSRTSGLPFGANSGHKAEVTGIDLLATAMEAAVVLLCVAVLVRPTLGRRLGVAGGVIGGAIAGFAMVATSVALASPSARDHSAVGHGASGHGATAAGDDHSSTGINEGLLSGSAAATGTADADHPHPDDAATGAVADGSAAAGTPEGATPIISAGIEAGGDDGGHHAATPSGPPVSALANRCDLAINPVAFWEETTIVHGGVGSTTSPAGSAKLDELIRETTKPGGEAKDAKVVAMLGQSTDAEYREWIRWMQSYVGVAHHAAAGAPDDNGGHGGHLGPQPWTAMTDQAECDQLNDELAQAKAVAMKYPHPGDAEAAGWTKVTGYVPGIAAHYMNFGFVDGTFNIDEPEMLLYDGTEPTSSMVGLSYYMIHDSDLEPTQGFAGPNDHFHRHIGLCVNDTGVIGDSTTTDEECTQRGGVKQGGTGGWMNHVWIVPGCESPWGMFSGASPVLERSLTEASGTDGGGCAGSKVRSRFDLTPGAPDNVPGVLVGAADPAA